jgi:acetyl esterase/lipase
MARFAFATLAVLALSCAGPGPAPTPQRVLKVRLWTGPAPVGDGTTESVERDLEVHLPDSRTATGVAWVVCPGGGYIRHVMDREGWPIAEWLNVHGIAAILLQYRLPKGRPKVALLDAHQAIRTGRSNAAAWGIDPARVGILGFSAGGHVASTAATHFDKDSRPDFAVLVYPVVTMGGKTHAGSKKELLGADPSPELVKEYSNELQVTDRTPPTFVTHAADDAPVPPENSRAFVAAMRENGVPVEYLEFPTGGHGFNGCKGPIWEEWKAKSLDWLRAQGILK